MCGQAASRPLGDILIALAWHGMMAGGCPWPAYVIHWRAGLWVEWQSTGLCLPPPMQYSLDLVWFGLHES